MRETREKGTTNNSKKYEKWQLKNCWIFHENSSIAYFLKALEINST